MLITEVDDESQRLVHQLHIGQQLHPPQVHALLLAGLRFDEQTVVDQQIVTKVLVEGHAAIGDAHAFLAARPVSGQLELAFEATHVDGLERSDAEVLLDSDGSVNDFLRQRIGLFIERMHM